MNREVERTVWGPHEERDGSSRAVHSHGDDFDGYCDVCGVPQADAAPLYDTCRFCGMRQLDCESVWHEVSDCCCADCSHPRLGATDNRQRASDGQRCSHCSAEWVKDMERHLQRHVEVAAAALRRVEELHSPIDHGTGPQCHGCATSVTFTPWPCKTITALRGES